MDYEPQSEVARAEEWRILRQENSRLCDELETLRRAAKLLLRPGVVPAGLVEALTKYVADVPTKGVLPGTPSIGSVAALNSIKRALFSYMLSTGDTDHWGMTEGRTDG